MELVFTRHALLAREKRGIKRRWCRMVCAAPSSVEKGRGHGVALYRGPVVDADGRILCVVLAPYRRKARVITAYWEADDKRSTEII